MAAAVKPLIVITGPTASGKTDLAIRLAREFGGEIVCADSRTVYRGLDIGTAKPTTEERALVSHHLLDVADPDEPYNLARFQTDARAAIANIRARGKVPFLVGGSGLYVDSIVLDYRLGGAPDAEQRAWLESQTLEQLFDHSKKINVKLPQNVLNKRYVIRAIEQNGVNSARNAVPDALTHVVAIKTDSAILKQRIQRRAQILFDRGLAMEARQTAEVHGWNVAPLQAPAYAAVRRFLHNELSREDAIAAFAAADWQLARKQLTWLRRHSWLKWCTLDEAETYVRTILTRA